MNKILFAFFLFSFNIYAIFDYEKESNRIIHDFLMESNPLGIFASGGGGQSCGEINSIILHLRCYQSLQLEQTRNLYLSLLSKLINCYNNNVKIRPYLHNYPFDHENISLMLSFYDSDHNRVTKDNVALIFIVNDTIVYQIYDDKKKDFVSVYSENATCAISNFSKQILTKPNAL